MNNLMNKFDAQITNKSIETITDKIINIYIEPILDKLFNKQQKKNTISKFKSKVQEYLNNSFDIVRNMNTIVFNNQRKKIEELYIPLTLSGKSNDKKIDKIKIDSYKDELIPRYKKVLLVDTAGMGKSTVIKFLFICCIQENKGIPILVELRRLNEDNELLNEITNQINGLDKTFSCEDILNIMQEGGFVLFLDGYDEISQNSREYVTKDIQQWIDQMPNNEYVLSSREENQLNCFGDFQRFDIEPLNKEEAYSLIKKYDKNGEISKLLIDKLENDNNLEMITEFLQNPLMVSLLYKTFEYKNMVPSKKDIFYRQVYNALFEDHDLSKKGAYTREKESKLNIEEFHRVLRTIGLLSLKDGVSYKKEKIIELIDRAKRINSDLSFDSINFLNDILVAVPIFVRDGLEYRWAHKSFQEYFAAAYLYTDSKEKQNEMLQKIISGTKIEQYYNVLDIYYDMDYKGFRRGIIYPIIKQFIEYSDTSYSDNYFNEYDKNELNIRKSMNFTINNMNLAILDGTEYESTMSSYEKFNVLHDRYNVNYGHSYIYNDEVFITYEINPYRNILQLLYYKKSELVRKIVPTHKMRLEKQLDDKLYYLDDNIDNFLNSKENFNTVNEFLCSLGMREMGKGIILDYTKCLKEINDIEEELKNEEEDINFF